MSAKAKFQHHCPACVFLDHWEGHDLYWCPDGDDGKEYRELPIFLARYGNGLLDTISVFWWDGHGPGTIPDVLRKAKEFWCERGLTPHKQFEHEACDEDVFLGHWFGHDLYWLKSGTEVPLFLARYGHGPHQFRSLTWYAEDGMPPDVPDVLRKAAELWELGEKAADAFEAAAEAGTDEVLEECDHLAIHQWLHRFDSP